MIKVKYLPRNHAGRYLVVSDPHGYYNQLMALLRAANFNREVDHLIIVGDLVDRGPDSMKCLLLMMQPWVTVVRGNHDDNILQVMKSIMDAKSYGMSRGSLISGAKMLLEQSVIEFDWFIEWLQQHLDWSLINHLITKLDESCHILVVGEGQHRFNAVHANLYDAGLSSDHEIDQIHGSLDQRVRFALLGARSFAKEALASGNHGKITHDKSAPLSITFCGHSIVPAVTSYKNHVFIDTGCYLRGVEWSGLTAVEWPSKKTHFVRSPAATVCQPVAA